MASKYRTGQTIPPEFPDILKDFVREILRHQPPNIFAFGSQYFREKAQNGGIGGGMSEEELVEYLTNLFLDSDKDGNGVLDKHEFKRLMQGADLGLSKKQIKFLYAEADINDDGTIEYREFIPACVELVMTIQARASTRSTLEDEEQQAQEAAADYFFHGMSKDELEHMLRESFNEADKDSSGQLDMKEFTAFLKSLPLNLTKREINMALMEVDTNQDGQVSLEEFVPLFHVIMIEMIKHSILDITRQPSELASFLIDLCQKMDTNLSGYLKHSRIAQCLRDADLGLSKFQIMMVMSEAPKDSDQGVAYEKFISSVAVPMIRNIVDVEESVQFKRTKAWKQVQDAEQQAELILGMSRDEFTKVMGTVFQEFDVDESGYLDETEFENAMRQSGIPFTDQQVMMLLSASDVNDDGRIQYGEFAEVAVQLMSYVQREAEVQGVMEQEEAA
uniref:EF-hand domain-containing protein n=1 Tax=Hemiselmis tepida TaxID=464990 RepID=A0A7S0VQW8_9CRYP|mmetsp:Transcript_24753/g.62729  ORF Transcript_24753/g.62729 Transcript_24753/m.62729 type:complete len:447 (+) Transcript_24753:151-1491(+)|eukprot:CAMPEP_0174928718 /NCGR_PEP_ID=MMETSP1355-20121228/25474_1 /TAXON_ID=464990 /ORGANISM="Hemiselmis tepida, Strain CCMP443" /LENGTH=446 /DNA_ID=CAMNT_0016174893 /DNA_START=129 /DNA_END=1469 /DNA_ORIENTATION=+